jgi:site-specific recombinase XerD
LRISEALALTSSDVDIENRRVFVRCGKGQKQRIVPMGPRTARAILSYIRLRNQIAASSSTLFLVEGGKAMNRRHAHQQIARIAKRAGIEESVGPHRLRHTCALWFLRRGGDAFSLQKLLGHATLEMTKRYVSMTAADISAAHAKFAPGDVV